MSLPETHGVPSSAGGDWLDWGGDGPLLHLAHANGFPCGTYTPLAELLTDRFHVVATPARPLWPGSDPLSIDGWEPLAEDLVRGLHTRGLSGIVGVGHSLGGVMTAMAAAADPTLFRGVVLIDPVLFAGFRAVLWGAMKRFGLADRLPLVKLALRRRERWDSAAQVRASYDGKAIFRTWQSRCLDAYVDHGVVPHPEGGVTLRYPREWEAQVFRTSPHDAWPRLRGIRVPLLALRGAESDTFLPVAARRLRRCVRGARVVDVPGTTHFVPMEQPEVVARHIRDFVDRLP